MIKLKGIVLAAVSIMTIAGITKGQGIQFEQNLSWSEVKEKAKAENKYIFLDCYATWCFPCKEMEKKIFTQEQVGTFFNDKFISVRLQLDTSRQDDDQVKSWYADAHNINTQYKIAKYPTFLFFSPSGELVHKGSGFLDVESLHLKGEEAVNPDKQYYTLVKNYKNGEKDTKTMGYLARTARDFEDTGLAKDVARQFTTMLREEDLFTKDNIQFLNDFTESSKDNSFKILYYNKSKVDSVMGKENYSQDLFEFIIAKEEIDPKLLITSKTAEAKPDWISISSAVEKKYNADYARRTIIKAKIRWYGYKQQWSEFTKNIVAKINMNGGNDMNGFFLNNDAWAVFEHSNDKEELETCIKWMEKLFNEKPEDAKSAVYLDTYANLLYKAGRKTEALAWEEKAVQYDPEQSEIRSNFQKMKDGIPTWPSN